MKLVSFDVQTVLGRFQRIGAVVDHHQGQKILDLTSACAWYLQESGEGQPLETANVLLPPNMAQFLKREQAGLDLARNVYNAVLNQYPSVGIDGATLLFDRESVRLRCPLPEPNSLRDFITFETHVKASAARRNMDVPDAWYQYPIYYKGNHRAMVGPDEPVMWPSFTEKLDFELELACIVGKTGQNIPVEQARDYILGYAVLNDFSARDRQLEEMKCRMGPAKGKDFANALGPYIVTADEVQDPRNLKMIARVNGETWCEGSSGWSHWTFEQMLSYVSLDETVYPGDILGSGTVDNGCGLDLGRWIQPGDMVELEIEGLGVLRNTVVKADRTALTSATASESTAS